MVATKRFGKTSSFIYPATSSNVFDKSPSYSYIRIHILPQQIKLFENYKQLQKKTKYIILAFAVSSHFIVGQYKKLLN